MKVLILYRPASEHSTHVEEFVREFERQESTRHVDLLDQDTPEAIEKAKIYDITQYPAVLALKDDGQMLQMWQGEQLPLMNELAYYTHEQ